jgi:hypothetical protein
VPNPLSRSQPWSNSLSPGRSVWGLFKLREYTLGAIERFSSEEDVPQISGRLEASVTVLPFLRNERVGQFSNWEHLKQALLASSCLVPLAGLPVWVDGLGYCIDGGLSDLQLLRGMAVGGCVCPHASASGWFLSRRSPPHCVERPGSPLCAQHLLQNPRQGLARGHELHHHRVSVLLEPRRHQAQPLPATVVGLLPAVRGGARRCLPPRVRAPHPASPTHARVSPSLHWPHQHIANASCSGWFGAHRDPGGR